MRLDEVSGQLARAEIEDFVTLRDVMTVVQRLELVRRIGLAIDYDAVELGTDDVNCGFELEELLGGNEHRAELIVRDYHANPNRCPRGSRGDSQRAGWLSDAEFSRLHRPGKGLRLSVDGRGSGFGDELTRLSRDGRYPPLQFAHADRLVREFGSLQGLLAASASDLEAVEGIGAIWARQVREGLSHLAESTIADPLG